MRQTNSRFNGGRILSSLFFPNPLDDFEPKKPDFEPEIDPDYDDSLCPVCAKRLDQHPINNIVECALVEVRGGKHVLPSL